MVFALTSEAFQILKQDLKERKVKRIYRAVVEGRLEGSGTWDSYLIEDPSLTMRVVPASVKGAERAVTHYKVLKSSTKYSLIDCELQTGKKNQIRAQASMIGHPIAGDKRYEAKETKAWRLCLHARVLDFIHPITKKEMHFESQPPAFFEGMIR
jgi:23S rRNA pseudouridine1911/1915/1917 synthase